LNSGIPAHELESAGGFWFPPKRSFGRESQFLVFEDPNQLTTLRETIAKRHRNGILWLPYASIVEKIWNPNGLPIWKKIH
jgi:hypothetical protein